MKKLLAFPNKDNIDLLINNTNIDGLILSLKDLSVESEIYFTIDDIKEILSKTNKEICICINKIMHEIDLDNLRNSLIELDKLNISKIMFYDIAVLELSKELNITKELVIYQEHLNASYLTNIFYKKHNVEYTIITNDITKEEINDISKYQKIMLICYGYLPIFYSRRSLISNYFDYINKDKLDDNYYLLQDNDYYRIKESNNGTCIYTKEPIDLINEIDNLNIEYIILNSIYISNEEFIKVIDKYKNNIKDNKDNYLGFLNEKTIYKVVNHE